MPVKVRFGQPSPAQNAQPQPQPSTQHPNLEENRKKVARHIGSFLGSPGYCIVKKEKAVKEEEIAG